MGLNSRNIECARDLFPFRYFRNWIGGWKNTCTPMNSFPVRDLISEYKVTTTESSMEFLGEPCR